MGAGDSGREYPKVCFVVDSPGNLFKHSGLLKGVYSGTQDGCKGDNNGAIH